MRSGFRLLIVLPLLLTGCAGRATDGKTDGKTDGPAHNPKPIGDSAADAKFTSASPADDCVDAENASFCEAERACHHVIYAENNCDALVQCEFMTNVDRSWVAAQIQPGSSVRLTTRRGAVDTEFEITKRCKFW